MTTELTTAAQQALEALSLALSDVDWRAGSPTQPVIHKAYNRLQSALTQRPAPGVPEGFALVPMTEDELNEMALQLGREMKGLRCWGWMDLVRAVERHHSKKLAAAQAKGGQ